MSVAKDEIMLKRIHIEEALVFAAKPNRRSKLLLLAVACACAWMTFVPTVLAQAGAPTPPPTATDHNAAPGRVLAFDVVSIKPIAPGGRPTHGIIGVMNHPDGLEADYVGLRSLIQYAYGYKRFPHPDDQITGVPDWAKSQVYDINAKMSADDFAEFQKLDKDGQEQWLKAMMQAMLADRFQLKIHQGTKQAPIFILVVAKSSSKLRDAATDSSTELEKDKDGKPRTGLHWLKDTSVAQSYSMASLADLLSEPFAGIGRPVVDKTGLTGTYNFTLNWSVYSARPPMPSPASGEAAAPDDSPSIFTALGELGLKLQPATGMVDTIVIDHVEKPSEN
jgi:uncharacterized protein (TIGR03435 family)